jgi:hypothetical protein
MVSKALFLKFVQSNQVKDLFGSVHFGKKKENPDPEKETRSTPSQRDLSNQVCQRSANADVHYDGECLSAVDTHGRTSTDE